MGLFGYIIRSRVGCALAHRFGLCGGPARPVLDLRNPANPLFRSTARPFYLPISLPAEVTDQGV